MTTKSSNKYLHEASKAKTPVNSLVSPLLEAGGPRSLGVIIPAEILDDLKCGGRGGKNSG